MYQLSKHIASIVSPLAGKTGSHDLNSKHFAETMRDITLAGDEVLVMSSLFINVSTDEAEEVIQEG